MAHFLFQHLHQFFAAFGYWAVFLALLGENAGLPLPGEMLMPWRKFLLFNFLGAVAWVSAVATVGFVFGREFEKLLRTVDHLNFIVFGLLILAAVVAYFHFRSRPASDEQ